MNDKLQSITVHGGWAVCPVCQSSICVRMRANRLDVEKRCSHFRFAALYDRLVAMFALA
ncbi:MAG: hypothetical protein IT168_05010 [Bryobacterales bacterium]|nr:hypothetical protein [Bryobacterales bacterium]